jgi:hypothetical protein
VTIQGHPSVEAINAEGRVMNITVCAECGALRSVLFLSQDRWLCTRCRAQGVATPTVVPLAKPVRRR